MGKIISRLLGMTSGQAAEDDLIPIQDVSVPKTKVITLALLRSAILKAASIVASMVKNENYTSGSWTVTKLNETTRMARMKLNAATFTTGQSKSFTITLPEGKNYNSVHLSSHLNNDGAYVEWFTYGTQFTGAAGSTAASLWARNYGSGTSGVIVISLICIYEV